jgi:hypothetical protein
MVMVPMGVTKPKWIMVMVYWFGEGQGCRGGPFAGCVSLLCALLHAGRLMHVMKRSTGILG